MTSVKLLHVSARKPLGSQKYKPFLRS